MNLPLLVLSLICTYGMVGCAYYGFLCRETPMAFILYGTLPLTAVMRDVVLFFGFGSRFDIR